MAVLMDIPSLEKKIQEIISTYVQPTTVRFIENESDVYYLRNFIRSIASNLKNKDRAIWRKNGIRWVSSDKFYACLDKMQKNTLTLGTGAFGTVFNVPFDTCIENIPPGIKHVGVKIEVIRNDSNQEPERVKEVTKIAKKANKIGVGPAIYDVFVTENKAKEPIIVKVFEIINGKTWSETKWESTEAKKKSVSDLSIAIHKMNQAGIIHHDLHSGNVMVDDTGKIYIIDYDRAHFVENEERWEITAFANNIKGPWAPKGILADDAILYIFDKLIEDGFIKLSGNVAVKANNKGNNKKLTAKLKAKAKAKND